MRRSGTTPPERLAGSLPAQPGFRISRRASTYRPTCLQAGSPFLVTARPWSRTSRSHLGTSESVLERRAESARLAGEVARLETEVEALAVRRDRGRSRRGIGAGRGRGISRGREPGERCASCGRGGRTAGRPSARGGRPRGGMARRAGRAAGRGCGAGTRGGRGARRGSGRSRGATTTRDHDHGPRCRRSPPGRRVPRSSALAATGWPRMPLRGDAARRDAEHRRARADAAALMAEERIARAERDLTALGRARTGTRRGARRASGRAGGERRARGRRRVGHSTRSMPPTSRTATGWPPPNARPRRRVSGCEPPTRGCGRPITSTWRRGSRSMPCARAPWSNWRVSGDLAVERLRAFAATARPTDDRE